MHLNQDHGKDRVKVIFLLPWPLVLEQVLKLVKGRSYALTPAQPQPSPASSAGRRKGRKERKARGRNWEQGKPLWGVFLEGGSWIIHALCVCRGTHSFLSKFDLASGLILLLMKILCECPES